ncbi:hypothetical protein HDU67_009263 [Dinochytrium kinnereticum]|nr:hypothetical protein HDU67_009263 [Dinochytrium kinnereticum]
MMRRRRSEDESDTSEDSDSDSSSEGSSKASLASIKNSKDEKGETPSMPAPDVTVPSPTTSPQPTSDAQVPASMEKDKTADNEIVVMEKGEIAENEKAIMAKEAEEQSKSLNASDVLPPALSDHAEITVPNPSPKPPKSSKLLEDMKELAKQRNRRKSVAVPELPAAGPGEIYAGRRGSIHVGQAPVKLTNSELDLLVTSTGTFKGGAGDAQRRFLSLNGGTLKTVRLAGPGGSLAAPLAGQMSKLISDGDPDKGSKLRMGRKTATQRAREKARGYHEGPVTAPKISVGLLTSAGSGEGGTREYLTVGRAPKMGIVDKRNRGNMAYLKAANPGKFKKQKAREIARSYLLSKWENLEELRLLIIAKMASLKHYHFELEDLRRLNTEIREAHKETVKETNDKISDILKENEQAHIEISKLEKKRKSRRKTLHEDYRQFEINATAEISRAEYSVDRVRKAVDDLTRDVQSLLDFKSLYESDPEALQKQVAEEVEKKKDLDSQRTVLLDAVRTRWEEEQRDIEATWMARVKILIDEMSQKLSGKIDCSLDGDVRRNMRLRREQSLLEEQMKSAKQEIERILEERKQILQQEKELADPRRNVLKLAEFMTCTPDMEFSISEKRTKNYGIRGIA